VHYTAGVDQPADILSAAAPAASAAAASRWQRVLDPLPASIALALVFTAAGLVELLTRGPVAAGYRDDGPLLITLTVASALSLALLWWSPLAGLCAAVLLLCAQSVAGFELTLAAVLAVVIASFATVAFDTRNRALAAGFVVAAGMVVVLVTIERVTWQVIAAAWVFLSVVWVLAVIIRMYRGSVERAERRAALFVADREARAREAVTEERSRLARELHDSVGHALNVVVLHAGAAQRVIETKPALAREALGSIETAARQALADIERMLGILRPPDDAAGLDAAPGLGQLERLCEQVRAAGLPVDLSLEGEARGLPASLDLTAYRIVQEALTNTLKHAGKTHARVTLRYAAGELDIDVLDDGRGVAPGVTGGSRGLLGMRERVVAFRGELTAGPRAEGGFAVRARLPLPKEGT